MVKLTPTTGMVAPGPPRVSTTTPVRPGWPSLKMTTVTAPAAWAFRALSAQVRVPCWITAMLPAENPKGKVRWTGRATRATILVVADVHQCPFCELKFLNRTELEFHCAEDHPPAEDDVEPGDGPPS